MATRIVSNAILETGIERLFEHNDTVLTVDEVYEYNRDQFGGMNVIPGVLDELLTLCEALEIGSKEGILKTYTTDNGLFFSIPYIQLSLESELALIFGNIVKPLVYNPKNKTYSIEGVEIQFKPQAYVKEKAVEITGAFFAVKFEMEVDGLSFSKEFSISCKVTKDENYDYKALVIKLQKGDPELTGLLQQVGKGGGFTKSFKPWMAPRGFYQVTKLEKAVPYMWQGKECFSRNATVTVINPNTGELGSETCYVSVLALPFNDTKLLQCENGYNYMIQIDGAFINDKGFRSTIGFGSIVGLKRGEFKPLDFQRFVQNSRAFCLAKRKTINTGAILTLEQVESETLTHMAPKNTEVVSSTEITKVNSAVSDEDPNFDDIPF